MSYSIDDYQFDVYKFFPDRLFNAITDIRVNNPEVVRKEAKNRRRRENLTKDGKLTILAADHPGRYITRSGDDPLIMGNRQSYLGRVLRVITNPEFDGVMGTPDIIEDLLIVNCMIKENGGEGFLDNKVVIGCMNRGGLAGTAFEMDDRFTAFTAESMYRLGLDGAKMMFRLDLSSVDSGKTIDCCSKAITECNKYDLPIFMEPLVVAKTDKGYETKKNAADLIKVIGVASALGDSSMNIWLKIPYCDGYEQVAKASTCPMLMLGGESKGDPTPIIEEFAEGMKAGSTIRGALVGRNVHHPGKDDPLAVALAINGIVHDGFDAEQAVRCLMTNRDKDIDYLTSGIK